MPSFRRSEVDELDRHRWRSEPGIFQIDFVEESQLAELADQLGVPAPDRLTRSRDSGASAKLSAKVGELGGTRGERVEAVYEQQASTARVLRRVIDRLWSTESVFDADKELNLETLAEVTSEMIGSRSQRDAVARWRFVLAERDNWRVRTEERTEGDLLVTKALSSPAPGVPPPTLDSLSGPKPFSKPLVVPLRRIIGPQPTMEAFGRLEPAKHIHAAVFGHAAELVRGSLGSDVMVVTPIAIFDRRGGSAGFSWSDRKA